MLIDLRTGLLLLLASSVLAQTFTVQESCWPHSPQSYFSAVAIFPSPVGADALVRPAEPSSAIFVVGSAHAACSGDESWKKIWDLNLNAVALFAPDKAIAVGPKGLIVAFTLAAVSR